MVNFLPMPGKKLITKEPLVGGLDARYQSLVSTMLATIAYRAYVD